MEAGPGRAQEVVRDRRPVSRRRGGDARGQRRAACWRGATCGDCSTRSRPRPAASAGRRTWSSTPSPRKPGGSCTPARRRWPKPGGWSRNISRVCSESGRARSRRPEREKLSMEGEACRQPGCGGTIEAGFCNRCGLEPSDGDCDGAGAVPAGRPRVLGSRSPPGPGAHRRAGAASAFARAAGGTSASGSWRCPNCPRSTPSAS